MKENPSTSRSTQGMSLVAVLAAVAVGGLLMVAVSQMMTNVFKSNATVSGASSFDLYGNNIRLVLQSQKACSGAFLDASGSMLKLASQYDTTPNYDQNIPIFRLGTQDLYNEKVDSTQDLGTGWKVARFYFAKAKKIGPVNVAGKNYTKWAADLALEAQGNAQSNLGPTLRTSRYSNINLLVNSSGQIELCGSSYGADTVTDDVIFGSCPVGTYLAGLNPDRSLICRSLEARCPNNYYIQGWDSAGSIQCTKMPTPPVPPKPVAPVPNTCSSWGFNYNDACPINLAGKSLVSVVVGNRNSKAGCTAGSSYGVLDDKGKKCNMSNLSTCVNPSNMWVDKGCRAEFHLYLE